MNYDLEDFFANGEQVLQEKSSEEILKSFLRSIIHLEMEFEFAIKKEIQVMKKVHRKNLELTNSNTEGKGRKRVKL